LESVVVKRIRKRTEKAGTETQPTGPEQSLNDGTDSLRSELEQLAEDGFTRQLASSIGWMAENAVLLAGVGVVVIAGFVGLYLTENQVKADNSEAAAAFQTAADTYAEVKAPEATAEGEEKKPSDEKGTYEKAARGFAKARQAYSAEPIASLAALGEAGAAVDLGEFERAVKLYDGFLANSSLDPFARAIALQGKASALESKGDIAASRATWQALGSLDSANFGLVAGMQEGRLLESEGNADAARKIYTRLRKEFAESLSSFGNRAVKTTLDRNISRLGESG
jgi:tetratricopeptide (TPR) repeat protein